MAFEKVEVRRLAVCARFLPLVVVEKGIEGIPHPYAGLDER